MGTGTPLPIIKPTQMKMKTRILLVAALTACFQFHLPAQSAVGTSPAPVTAPEARKNPAIIPVPRTGSITNRQAQVLRRAKEAPGDYDIAFIGDSITQGWESPAPKGGRNVWQEFYGKRKVINFGVSGDRTEHVLWRFEQGQMEGIKAKVSVVMIGTNNSNKNQDGTDTYSDAEILEGITTIVNEIRRRQPETQILLLGIFPRAKTFSPQRGRLLQINQALAKLDDGQHVFYLDLGSQLIEKDGSISQDVMPDALHPNEAGYRIWAAAMEPKLKELLGHR